MWDTTWQMCENCDTNGDSPESSKPKFEDTDK